MQNDFFGSGIGQLSLEETINQEIQKISRVNYKNKDLPDLPQNNITNLQISKSPIYTEGPTNTNIVVTQFGNIEEVKTERDQKKKITTRTICFLDLFEMSSNVEHFGNETTVIKNQFFWKPLTLLNSLKFKRSPEHSAF